MYRLQPDAGGLDRLRSTEFASVYQEQHLEDWLEAYPGLLTDDEPVLVIGRQVTTALGGTLDLLALDADGSTLIAELKRAPTPRDVIAQVFEYAAWVASLDHEEIVDLAEQYLAEEQDCPSLAEAWRQAFYQDDDAGTPSSDLPAGLTLNQRQRLVVLTEGASERVIAVARYLRAQGVDITVLDYAYYRSDTGEEILNVTRRVGRETMEAPGQTEVPLSEARLFERWGPAGTAAYKAFREALLQGTDLEIAPRKTAVSFYKHTRDGRVFVCYFYRRQGQASAYLRSDSLADHIDVDRAMQAIESELPKDSHIRQVNYTWAIEAPCTPERGHMLGELVLRHVASQIS
jgi:hypothetical protein